MVCPHAISGQIEMQEVPDFIDHIEENYAGFSRLKDIALCRCPLDAARLAGGGMRLFMSGSDRAADRWREDYAIVGEAAVYSHRAQV
jgi:hypothetical protein